jgi:hypothetical protein
VRTTVTLDPDVERLLREAMREKSLSFKEALNQAVKAGLQRGGRSSSGKFRQRTFAMGQAMDLRLVKALALADALEDEQIVHKLDLRK